jgi:hypothetical protein
MFEVVTKSSDIEALFKQVADAALNWDGKHAIRYGT